ARRARQDFDVHLGGLSGFDLRDRLLASGRRIPVLFLTAHDDAVARERARRAGRLPPQAARRRSADRGYHARARQRLTSTTRASSVYFSFTRNMSRRFCDQHASLCSRQSGRSSPNETIVMRSPWTPWATR